MVPRAFLAAWRTGQRFHLALPMKVRVQENSIPIHPRRKDSLCGEAATITENISSRGCYFPLSRRLPLGTHLELAIKLPGERIGLPGVQLHCKGEVIRVDSPSNDGPVGIAATIDSYRLSQVSEEKQREASVA